MYGVIEGQNAPLVLRKIRLSDGTTDMIYITQLVEKILF